MERTQPQQTNVIAMRRKWDLITLSNATVFQPNDCSVQRSPMLGSILLAAMVFVFNLFLPAGLVRSAAAEVQTDKAAAAESDLFEKRVNPFVKKYCIDCHDDILPQAGIDFTAYDSRQAVLEGRKTWERVFRILQAGAMPPDDHDSQPTLAEREQVVQWLEETLFAVDCTLTRDPGRVTIRRLNRAEYNNTIRDLIGVDFQPAADFPSDDVGYGFDNIGDVLSLPPLLMEKYLDAAEEIAEKAIIPEDPAKGTGHRFEYESLTATNGSKPGRRGVYGLSSTSSVYAKVEFPRPGKYILRARAAADQAGPEPARMEFRLGEKAVKVFDIEGERKPAVYETTVTVEAGSQRFDAAFINDYYQPEAEDPDERDRNLYIRYLEVQGPVDVPPEVLPDTHRRIITCRPSEERSVRECAEEIIRRFAGRAYRRPARDAEVERLAGLVGKLVEEGEVFERAIQVAVQAVLVSPHFLFRVERDRRPNDSEAEHRISDYELASRLSYFLWSSMPDETLFTLAKKKSLHKEEILEEQVRRMLKDPKSQALVDNFATQWLNLRNLEEVSPDPKKFATFDDRLRADMLRETKLFFQTIMREDRSILEFLDAKFTFVNERLAQHYGLAGVTGDKFQRVSLADKPRRGVLTHASVLTLTSNPTRSSPVMRGKWILENILDSPPPPPPENVPELEETAKAAPETSLREQLELHRKNPVCASCHREMDPLGFGFENFDAIGRWRDRDGEFSIDSSGTLPGGYQFDGPVELVQILKKRKSEFSRCLARKMLTYALGRGLDFYDKCAVDEILKNLEENEYRFSALVLGIVQSEPFRMRRGDGGTE